MVLPSDILVYIIPPVSRWHLLLNNKFKENYNNPIKNIYLHDNCIIYNDQFELICIT